MDPHSTEPRSAPPTPSAAESRSHRLPGRLVVRPVSIDWNASDDRRPLYILGALIAAVGVLLMYMGRGETFFYDEWAYVVEKFGGGLQSLLEPHSEHFSLVPIAIYKVLFHLVGLNHYPVFRLVLVVMHLIGVGLIYDLGKRRIGAWPALVPAALILCLFAAWQNLLWAFQMGFVGSVVAGLAAWALIDRDTRACDIAAGVALGIALSSSGLGIPFVPGIAAELVWQRRWRRLWLVAVPFALYVLWYTQYGANMVTSDSIIESPQWILGMLAAGVGALVGRDLDWGVPLTVLVVALAARRVLGDIRLTPRLIGAAVTAAAYCTLTGISRSTIQPPDESRYVYLVAICVVVIGMELLPRLKINARKMGLAAIVVFVSALMGWQTLHDNALILRQDGQTIAAQLGGLQLEAAYAPPAYSPSPTGAPNITAGPYLHAARAMGSYAGDSPATLVAAAPGLQAAADAVIFQILNPTPEPAVGRSPIGPPPTLESVTGARVATAGSCLSVSVPAAGAVVYVTLPRGGVLIRNHAKAPASLALRRFSPAFTALAVPVNPHQNDTLVLPPDGSTIPWHLQVNPGGPVAVCSLRR